MIVDTKAMPGEKDAGKNGEPVLARVMTIRNQLGLHARAAAKFVTLAGGFDADITVSKGGQTVSGRSIMGLMMLAASPQSEIELSTTGPQAAEAMEALCAMIENKFEEN